MKGKEELVQREFLVAILHPKWGKMFWTCVKDNIIKENKDYKAIGLY